MTVVPQTGGMEFEVQVSPEAIDTVHVGQPARVRFPAFDQRSTPELTGEISSVSPDSVTDPATGRSFYRVDVALLPEELANDPILYPAQELMSALEFGAAATLTDPNRAELMARFKSA